MQTQVGACAHSSQSRVRGSIDLAPMNSFLTFWGGRRAVDIWQLTSAECPSGCVKCPNGNEALGLTCDLISEDASGDDTITCKAGDEW